MLSKPGAHRPQRTNALGGMIVIAALAAGAQGWAGVAPRVRTAGAARVCATQAAVPPDVSRGATSVVAVVARDGSGNRVASGIGVFVDIGRLVVPRALLTAAYSAAVVYGGKERGISAVLADDPRAALTLVAVDLPDGAPPAIRTASAPLAAVRAGTYYSLAADGTSSTVQVLAEHDLPGFGPACGVTPTGPLPPSGSPIVDEGGRMIGVLVDRVAGETHLPVILPAARVVRLPGIAPSTLTLWRQQAQATRSADAEAAFLRGLQAALGGEAQAAAARFREAAGHDRDDADARAALGASELAAGHRDAALAAYREAIAADPVNPRYHHDLGVAFADADRWEEATAEFAEVARLRPADAEAHFNLGAAYGKLGRYEDEYRAYQAALQQNAAHVGALRNLGIACIALKRYTEAVAVSARAIRFLPSDAQLHTQLGVAYFDLRDYTNAAEELKKAIALDPGLVKAHYGLAVTYAASGQREAALAECERLKSLDPARAEEVQKMVVAKR